MFWDSRLARLKMAQKPLKNQQVARRRPQQGRALEKVGLMLEAATRILDKQGLAGLTTNRVAEVAGVSIGSLYQYFPDKRGLVEAIRQRHFAEVLAVVEGAARERAPLGERLEHLVAGMLLSLIHI